MARKIVITSGKGGVGKTTLCFLIGKMLSKKGEKVAIFDVDIGLNNLDVVSGVEGKVMFDIVDVALHRCRVWQALICADDNFDLFVLPSAHDSNVGRVDLNGIRHVVDSLDKHFDYILIDCPAGIDYGFLRAVFCANEAIIVSTPHICALRDASKVSQVLATLNLESVGLVLNRVDTALMQANKQLSPIEISQTLNLNLLGIVEENKEILVQSSLVGSLTNFKAENLNGLDELCKNIFDNNYILKNQANYLRG